MKKIELLKKLERYPVVTLKSIRELTQKKREYARLFVHRMKKDGLLTEIERGKYTVHLDPFLVASHIVWPSYISCLSALRYHNLTEQLPVKIEVVTTRARKERKLEFGNAAINFIRVKPCFFFGFAKARYGQFEVFVADSEKAMLDAAMLRTISFSAISEALSEHRKEIDTGRLVNYLIRTGDAALGRRFGFLLEKLRIKEAKKLEIFRKGRHILLDYSLPERGRKNEKWLVTENA